ncbi:MAG: Flp pilus assembly complex ATPase component TadA [Proteobacteria bacterium]|nr:Flp pilus assembly complex ATPase component TadA [Pseudomonadota bacterium]
MAVKKIGELLVESGLISPEQLSEVLRQAKGAKKGKRLGSLLVSKGFCDEIDIAQTLSFQLKIPFVDLASTDIEPEAVELMDEKLANKHLVLPISVEKKVLKLAMADPLNLDAIDDIRFSTGLQIQPCVSTTKSLVGAIRRQYNMNEPIEELVVDLKQDSLVEVVHESDSGRDLTEQVRRSAAPPIIKMVDSIIVHAVENKASDIHIEPQEKEVKLRLRVDGIMRETMQLPKWVQGPVVSRIKIMAKMDIAERRVSQDGRIKVRIGERSLDLRISTLPTHYGETVVLRVLDSKASVADLDGLGLSERDHEVVKDMIDRPQGIVLVTGPTGSGKSSSLYAMITSIMSEKINIITIEDPIEYELKGVNQVAVNEKTGLTFAYTLRSVLRQDPDVILVGEMRDTETAVIAHQASLTGHLVFTTLHTNDAVSSVVRLKNMDVPNYMIGTALNGIVAQRLVRSICSECKESYRPEAGEIERYGALLAGTEKLYRGAGCESCNGTGYSGRIGVFEVLSVNDRFRSLVATDAPEHELVKAAVEGGMTPLHMDGVRKVLAGKTTIEELTRVVYLSKSDSGAESTCPWCSSAVESGSAHCSSCGKNLLLECPGCAKTREPDWVACPYCAEKFDFETREHA